jgi:alpha-D-xyloside xylohydrolase
MLSSHSRAHGIPPKEPWEYNEAFTDAFRQVTEMRYRLMPYIYAQAKQCTQKGLPMVRALFVEYPDDPGCWQVEDQYLFGSDILVAPLMHEGSTGRNVYLPAGQWIDYQTGKTYAAGWQSIEAGNIPAIVLVRDGAVIPHIKLAQSTSQMDWSNLDLVVFSALSKTANGRVCLPTDQVLHDVSLTDKQGKWNMETDPAAGKVKWNILTNKEYKP